MQVKAIQPDGKILGIDGGGDSAGNAVRFNPDGSGDQSFGNAEISRNAGGRGRLRVLARFYNGTLPVLEAGHILVRPNGRINLIGYGANIEPGFVQRAAVSQQNTTLTGTFSAPVPMGVNVSTTVNDVNVTFSAVVLGGELTTTTIAPNSAGSPPSGYTIPPESPAYDITTTAVYTPPVDVCVVVPSVNDRTEFSKLHLLHGENGSLVDRTISQNFSTRTVCARVNSLSPFVIAVGPVVVTAAAVTINGRVLTSTGKGIAKAIVSMTDVSGNERRAMSDWRGYYRFQEVAAGETRIFSVRSKRYQFANNPTVIFVSEDIDDVNFTALP